jgi:hypothetical protein
VPTTLPRRGQTSGQAKKRLSLFDIVFNTFLVVSALMLTFVVLVREEENMRSAR